MTAKLSNTDRLTMVYYLAAGEAIERFKDRGFELKFVVQITGLDAADIDRSFDEVNDFPARFQTFSYVGDGSMSPAERVTCLRIMGRCGMWPFGIKGESAEVTLIAKLLDVTRFDAAMAHDDAVQHGFIGKVKV
jgi:hypothetical protein